METTRKLYRSTTDRKVAGVCGGLGHYLNVDPTILRFIFLFGFLASGSILFWLYVAMWLVLPEA